MELEFGLRIRDVINRTFKGIFDGEYRVFTESDGWFLCDSTGAITFSIGNIDNMDCKDYVPANGDIVNGGFSVEFDGPFPVVHGRIEILDTPTDPLMTLPYPVIPYPALVLELHNYIKDMSWAPLKEFLLDVLRQEDVAIGLARAPASISHHHCEEGGLLRHTVEMARYAVHGELFLCPDTYERELLLVATVIHDIGKAISSSFTQCIKPGVPKEHKAAARWLIKPALERLERSYPSIAKDICDIRDDIFGKHETSTTAVGRMLQSLDRDSAFSDCKERAFQGTPKLQLKASLNGREGSGWTYRRFSHLHVANSVLANRDKHI